MVGVVIVSHSNKLAEGVKEVASQMASEVKIESAVVAAIDSSIGKRLEEIVTELNKMKINKMI